MKDVNRKFTSTREALLAKIEEFLEANPDMKAQSFGWLVIKDQRLVSRLRGGGDVTTRKLDAVLRFLGNPNKKDRFYDCKGKSRRQKKAGAGEGEQGKEASERSGGGCGGRRSQ